MWAGSPVVIKKTGQRKKKGDDGGCFKAALEVVRQYGGVLEHPWCSHAWPWFALTVPPRSGGWVRADDYGGMTCCVEQGRYGHYAPKPTMLYAVGCELPELDWGVYRVKDSDFPDWAMEKWGREKCRKAGLLSFRGGGKDSHARIHTPEPFRDLLISIARTATLDLPYNKSYSNHSTNQPKETSKMLRSSEDVAKIRAALTPLLEKKKAVDDKVMQLMTALADSATAEDIVGDEMLHEAAQCLRETTNLRKELAAYEKLAKGKKDQLEHALLDTITDKFPKRTTQFGTLSRSTTVRYSLKDMEEFNGADERAEYAKETGDFSCFARSVPKEFVDEYMEANDGKLPEFVSGFDQVTLSFTAPRAKAPKR